MIPIQQLFYKIDQRLNKVATLEHQQIAVEDKVLIAREAVIKLIKEKMAQMDRGRLRYADLQELVEPAEDHPLVPRESDPVLHRWTVDMDSLEPSFFYYLDAYLLAQKEDCTAVVWVNADLIGHASVPLLLHNANYKPSFEYGETFCDLSHDTLGVYTDGSFTPLTLYLSYLRYPRPLDIEGYEDFDGNPSTNVDLELSGHLEDELLDIIARDLALYTENPAAFAAKNQQPNS